MLSKIFFAVLTSTSKILAATSIGCWTDSATRTLQGTSLVSNSMTTEICESFCKNYPLFGTEDGNECYCGSVLTSGALFYDGSWVGCTVKCLGNNNEFCGGPWGLNLYVH